MNALLRYRSVKSKSTKENGELETNNKVGGRKSEGGKPHEPAASTGDVNGHASNIERNKASSEPEVDPAANAVSPAAVPKQAKRTMPETLNLSNLNEAHMLQQSEALELREQLLDRRDREFERRDRELDRRERELERRERELDRREREFEQERTRTTTLVSALPLTAGFRGPLLTPTATTPPVELNSRLEKEIAELKAQFQKSLAEERRKSELRETQLEARIQKNLSESLEKERQTYYGFMKMSDREVSEMVEDTVGYLMEKDEDIADRVRFQSLVYLSQEKLASEAGISPDAASGSLAVAWKVALGPSLVTEDRLNKAQELFKDREVSPATSHVLENKPAVEYVVEFMSHLRKEGSDSGEQTFAPGRISREAYLETVKRQAKLSALNYEALVTLVDYISPSST